MDNFNKQEDVQDYFVRHATRFNGLYGNDNMSTRIFDKLFRRPMFDRYVYTINELSAANGKSYLDLGCGSGRYAVALAELGANVTGLDFSDAMLRLAKDYADTVGKQDKLTLINTDINDWMSKTNLHYDASYAMGVFDYLATPAATLGLMLKVSDKAIFSVPSPTFPRSQLRTLRYKMQNCPLFYFRLPDVEKLVFDAGGKITTVKNLSGAGFWVNCKRT